MPIPTPTASPTATRCVTASRCCGWAAPCARPAVVETYGSQSDLAATLLAQLGIAHGDFLFSRDLFDPARPKFGYWCFNNGFGVADAGGTTIFDCTSARVISPDSTAAQLRDGKAMLQTTYKAIREL